MKFTKTAGVLIVRGIQTNRIEKKIDWVKIAGKQRHRTIGSMQAKEKNDINNLIPIR